jgi:hypothetical protein
MPLTLQERLDEAETALHELLTGRAVVEVRDMDGSSIRYTRAQVPALRRYIDELKAQLTPSTNGGPMRLVF